MRGRLKSEWGIILGFLGASTAITIIAKQAEFKGPELEASKTAATLLDGLMWYVLFGWIEPKRTSALILLLYWILVALSWILVIATRNEHWPDVYEAMVVGFTIYCAELTLRGVRNVKDAAPPA